MRNISLYKYLTVEKKELVLSKQVLRSGTSIGANVVEANQAQSKADFVHKLSISLLSISLKEAYETKDWIELLRDSEYIAADAADSLTADCCELQKILSASIRTAKASLRRTLNLPFSDFRFSLV